MVLADRTTIWSSAVVFTVGEFVDCLVAHGLGAPFGADAVTTLTWWQRPPLLGAFARFSASPDLERLGRVLGGGDRDATRLAASLERRGLRRWVFREPIRLVERVDFSEPDGVSLDTVRVPAAFDESVWFREQAARLREPTRVVRREDRLFVGITGARVAEDLRDASPSADDDTSPPLPPTSR